MSLSFLSTQQKNFQLFKAVRGDNLEMVKHYLRCGATDIANAYGIACTQKAMRCEPYLRDKIKAWG